MKVQNERRMASFFVWRAWWCRVVLMHRTRWSFLESLPQPLPKGKGFGAALPGIFFGETKRRRDEESKRRRVKETKRQRDKESKSQRDGEMKRRRGGCLMGLHRDCSIVVQWLFNGRSMVGVVFPGRRGKFLPRRGKKSGCLALMSVGGRFCTRLSCIFLTFSSRCHQVGEEKGRCGVERCQ